MNLNTLDQSASCQQIQIEASTLNRGRHLDTCSTNVTGKTDFEYIGADS